MKLIIIPQSKEFKVLYPTFNVINVLQYCLTQVVDPSSFYSIFFFFFFVFIVASSSSSQSCQMFSKNISPDSIYINSFTYNIFIFPASIENIYIIVELFPLTTILEFIRFSVYDEPISDRF